MTPLPIDRSKMIASIGRAIVPGILAIALTGAVHRAAAQAAQLNVSNVIGWLPPNTETLIVANGPIAAAVKSAQSFDLAASLAQSVAFRLFRFRATQDLIRPLDGAHIRFAVEGARAFRRPQGFGLSTYDGCHIIVFDNADIDLIDQFLHSVETASVSKTKIDGIVALQLKWRAERDAWTAFVVRVRPEVVIVATSERMLTQVLQRAKAGADKSAFPSSLPEWSGADTSARVWAIRHYARGGNAPNPTSPLTSTSEEIRDTQAVGIALSVGHGSSVYVAHYYSRNPQAKKIAQRLMSNLRMGVVPPLVSETNGDVRISGTAIGDTEEAFLLLLILGAFGHEMVI